MSKSYEVNVKVLSADMRARCECTIRLSECFICEAESRQIREVVNDNKSKICKHVLRGSINDVHGPIF